MSQKNRQYRFPAPDATDDDIKEFHEKHFATLSRYRSRQMERINRSLWYIIGKQWAELDTSVIVENARGFALKEMGDNQDIELPRPVTNLIAPAVDVEFATLSKRQWVPKIPTYSRDPRMSAAAKVAHDVLNDRLKKLYWEDLRDQFILDCISTGTATFHSFWDASFFETTWSAVEAPVFCPACQKLYASALIPGSYMPFIEAGNTPNAADTLEDGEQVELSNCPYCAGPFSQIDLQEADSHGTDLFGRPLGGDVPKGQTALELVSPFEYYPQNAGLDVTPETIKQHGICKIRSLDWVEEHHPELIEEVEPEEAAELMEMHPLLGEWDILGRYDHSLDSGMYDCHVRVYDLFADPSYRFPEGRAIRIIGKRQKLIARNEGLIRELQFGEQKLKVQTDLVTSAIWKPRKGEFWGKTLPDDLLSPQNRLNGIDAQVIEARERMGSPNVLVPGEEIDLTGPAWRPGYGLGKFLYYNPSAISPNAKPEVFGGVTMPSGVNLERDRCEQSMTKIIGPADIEIGEAPRNITTTSGLQILGEQAERRRATRERGITSAFKKVWEHQLQLLWTLRVDEDSYEAESPDGRWEIKQYTREALGGQTKVEIEKQAYIERSIIDREAAMEARNVGLYDLSTPLARKKFLDFVHLPTDINEDSNLQIEHAQRIWVDFVDSRKVPVIDTSVDDPMIRYHVLGTMLLQEEGQRISEEALWPQIIPVIAGWEDDLQQMITLDAQARLTYGGEPPPLQAAEMYARLKIKYDETMAAYDAAQAQPPVPGAPPLQPPAEIPPPVFLPKQPEQQIYLVWQGMFKRKGQQPTPADPETGAPATQGSSALDDLILQTAPQRLVGVPVLAGLVDSYLRFRAVFEAYRKMSPVGPVPGTTPNPAGPVAPMPPGMQKPGPSPTPETPAPPSPTPVGA